jgi:hypothetical protein
VAKASFMRCRRAPWAQVTRRTSFPTELSYITIIIIIIGIRIIDPRMRLMAESTHASRLTVPLA